MSDDALARMFDEHRARMAKARAKQQHKENAEGDDFGGYLPTEEEIEAACQELRMQKKQRGEVSAGEMTNAGRAAESLGDPIQDVSRRSCFEPIGGGGWRRTIHNGQGR